MATNDPTPATKYFWLATVQWPVHNGMTTTTLASTFHASGPVSRVETLNKIKQRLGQHGVPETANVLFLTIEPDQIPGPVM